MQKRGQATVFIILGLVIVASVITIVAFRDSLFLSEWEKQRALSLTVPEEAEELHAYLSDCVVEVISEPVQILGQQGGYIDIPSDPIGDGDHNPFSNSLEIFPDTDFETAYWFYLAANGVAQDQVPSLEEMEVALAAYVDDNVAACSDDFSVFLENNASIGDVNTEVEILDDEVRFIVDYPVHMELDDFSFDFAAFYESVDVPLGAMYGSALEIMETENEELFLEDLTYDMFVLYEEIPFSWTEFDCEQETWDFDVVEDDLKNIIMHNLLAVKIAGTDYEILDETDEKYFEWDAVSGSNDYQASLRYSDQWPLELQVYPLEDDGTLREDSYLTEGGVSSYLQQFFCITQYNFIYDLQYPVLISLYDPETDYTFQFATMVVLDNNQARENTEGLLDIGEVESPICDNAVTPITVYTSEATDSGALKQLDGVDVSFDCITSSCPLGETGGSAAYLNTVVPQCLNGVVVGEKEGYNRGVEIIDTLESSTVTVVLEKFYDLPYEIKVVDADGVERAPTSDDTIIITLTEKDTGYTTTVSYPMNTETVQLAAGNYEVSGSLITDSPFGIDIPAAAYTACSSVPLLSLDGLFGTESDADCTDVEIDELEIQEVVAGAVEVDWNVDRGDLSSASSVTFYVTSPGVPEDIEELDAVLAYIDAELGMKEPELQ